MTRLPDAVVERIVALVDEIIGKKKLGLVEVQSALRSEGLKVSLPTISKEAYRLGFKPQAGRRAGTKMPDDAKRCRLGGRPKGPGKKYSPNRARVTELRRQGLSYRAIALEVGLTAEGVRKLLLPDLSKTTDDNK